MKIRNKLAELRAQQGLSAQQLAEQAGVQRQSIYAMEAGTYVPNTLIALRLAQTLQVKVEELFSLEDEMPSAVAEQEVEVLDLGERLVPGQPLQLCRIGTRTVGVPAAPVPVYLPPADAVLTRRAHTGRKSKARIQRFRVDKESTPTLLIAGCDPGISVLRRHLGKAGMELVMASCSSSRALELLKENQIHVAGSHLRDEKTGESNLPAVRELFPRKNVVVANFAVWEQGIVVARGNPKVIRKAEDLTRRDLRLINRQAGSGSRYLLDATLRQLGCKSSDIKGYDTIASGHIPAAWHVQSGFADYCVATRAAAQVFGLAFLPLMSERFDLVIPKHYLELPSVKALLDTLNRAAFRRELEILGGYDTSQTGKRWM